MEMNVTLKFTYDEMVEFVDDICCTAFEGGINYWVDYAEYVEDRLGAYMSEHVANGGSIIMYGYEDDEKFYLDRNAILNGIEKYISEFGSRNLISNGKIDTYNVDAEVADCIVQLGLFGELIYG